MKLTPEQKAFYEYGKAREALRLFKTDFAYREETLREFYENYVRNAWRKRAECRDWVAVPLANRNCENCANSVVNPIPEVCKICMMTNFSGWEPIKWNK